MANKENHSPGQRIDIGDAVLDAAKALDTKTIKQRLARFAAAHKKYGAAEKAVEAAHEKLAAAQRKVADADVAQDDAIDALATARIQDGAPRTKPFKDIATQAPSALQSLGYVAEATACKKIAAAAKKKGGKNTAKAAAALEKAANAVVDAMKPLASLQKAHASAMAAREALALEWETALAALKRGARAAADDGAPGLYDALFASLPKPSPKKKAPAPSPTSTNTSTAPVAPAA